MRFTRVVWGLGPSPFLLNGTLKEHLDSYQEEDSDVKDIAAQIQKDLYVDDLTSGGCSEHEARVLKDTAIEIFEEGGFKLHKWHSNVNSLEDRVLPDDDVQNTDDEQTFAKEEIGVRKHETKILGVHWRKDEDLLGVDFGPCKKVDVFTKREVLKCMASVYDPLGVASPLLFVAKHIYRLICDKKLAWDASECS